MVARFVRRLDILLREIAMTSEVGEVVDVHFLIATTMVAEVDVVVMVGLEMTDPHAGVSMMLMVGDPHGEAMVAAVDEISETVVVGLAAAVVSIETREGEGAKEQDVNAAQLLRVRLDVVHVAVPPVEGPESLQQ